MRATRRYASVCCARSFGSFAPAKTIRCEDPRTAKNNCRTPRPAPAPCLRLLSHEQQAAARIDVECSFFRLENGAGFAHGIALQNNVLKVRDPGLQRAGIPVGIGGANAEAPAGEAALGTGR